MIFFLFLILANHLDISTSQSCEASRGPGGGKFIRYKSIGVNESFNEKFLIRNFTSEKFNCIQKCFSDMSCRIYAHNEEEQVCDHFNDTALEYLVTKETDRQIFIRREYNGYKEYDLKKFTEGIVHFWTFDTLTDIIGGQNLSQIINGKFAPDRHANDMSAIEFYSGYAQFPVGQYFNPSGYTYMIWVKRLSSHSYGGLIGFSKSENREGAIEMYHDYYGRLTVTAFEDTLEKKKTSTNYVLPIATWVHIAVTSNSKTITVYINSVSIGSFQSVGTSGETQSNYLGYFSYSGAKKAHAVFDEFKIFNRELSVKEITYEMDLTKEVIYEQPLHILSAFARHTEGLVHYWPFASSTRDIINGKDLTLVENGKLCEDRFGNKKSAVFFHIGYGTFPAGQYFEPTGYTYMIWVKPLGYSLHQGIIGFSKTQHREGAIEMYLEYFGCFRVTSYENSIHKNTDIKNAMKIGEWVHIAVTSDSKRVNVYIDSILNGSFLSVGTSGETQFNYLGLFSYSGAKKAHAVFDEFKIYNRKLTVQEISIEMNKVQTFDVIKN